MSKEKLSVQELIELMTTGRTVSKKTVDEFIRVLFSTIEDAMVNGDSVKIKGLGTFKSQWNEPRKSVDVNSGEEIIIDGYYKAVFTPDTELKESVNEPFAHLEPVSLDNVDDINNVLSNEYDEIEEEESDGAEAERQTEDPNSKSAFIEPLSVFEKQAEEIKGLIGEINSLASKRKQKKEKEQKIAIEPDYIPDVTPIVEEVKAEVEFTIDVLSSDGDIVSEAIADNSSLPLHIEEIDEFDTIRDLSYLQIEDKSGANGDNEDKKEIEKANEDVGNQLVEANAEQEPEPEVKVVEEVIIHPLEKLVSTEDGNNSQESASNDEVVNDNETIEIKNIETDEKPIAKQESSNKDASLITLSAQDAKRMTGMSHVEPEPKNTNLYKWWLYPTLAFLLVSLVWLAYNIFNFNSKQKEQTSINLLADSVANELRVQAIADSLAGIQESKLEDAQSGLDSSRIKTIDPNLHKENVPSDSQSEAARAQNVAAPKAIDENIFEKPRQYNAILATEKMVVGSQLTKFAKKYYGNVNFWVYIYEANKSKISNPDNVPTGIDIKIPKLDKRLVDPEDKKCIEFARKLQHEYLKKL